MRKNILIFAHNAVPHFIDICNQYASLFDSKLFKVTIAFLSGAENAKAREAAKAEEILFLNCTKKEIRGLKIDAIKKVYNLCKQRQFNMVFCQRYKPTYIMLWVAQFCKIPHLYFIMHAMGTMQSWGRRFLISLLFRKNMTFAGVSNAVAQDLQSQLTRVPANNIVTLYNAIDVDAFNPLLLPADAAKKELGLLKNEFVFGTIARLAPEKDQATLINAFAQVHKLYPNSKLVIIGEGPKRQALEVQINNLNLEGQVKLTGFITNAFRLAPAFDAFILNSTKEAFGRSIIEAMLAKLPVIGTNINGIPEVIGDAGCLIEAGNVEQLTQAMLGLIANPDQQKMLGEKSYQRVNEFFSVRRFYKDFWQKLNFENSKL